VNEKSIEDDQCASSHGHVDQLRFIDIDADDDGPRDRVVANLLPMTAGQYLETPFSGVASSSAIQQVAISGSS